VAKSGVLEHKSGNISETRKDRWTGLNDAKSPFLGGSRLVFYRFLNFHSHLSFELFLCTVFL